MLFKVAGIANSLFLNVGRLFVISALRQACVARDVQANIVRNRRATEWQTDDDIL